MAKKNIDHRASADSQKKNLASRGRFYFSSSLNFFSNLNLLPEKSLQFNANAAKVNLMAKSEEDAGF